MFTPDPNSPASSKGKCDEKGEGKSDEKECAPIKGFYRGGSDHRKDGQAVVLDLKTDAAGITGLALLNRERGQRFDFPAPMSLNEWHCIELELTAGTASSASLYAWVDEVPVSTASSGGGFDFNRTLVGVTYDVFQGAPVFIDEVVSAAQRIGCQ